MRRRPEPTADGFESHPLRQDFVSFQLVGGATTFSRSLLVTLVCAIRSNGIKPSQSLRSSRRKGARAWVGRVAYDRWRWA
jgi:hypothetical protein